MNSEYKYPIKVVSQMTGLSVHVIRAWEKRYNVVEPDRTDTNRRLYSEEDIEKLRLLNDASHLGHNIGSLATLSSSELKNLLAKEKSSVPEIKTGLKSYSPANLIEEILKECIESIVDYDAKKLESILLNTSAKLTQPVLIEEIIIPLVYNIGDMWHNGDIRVANEHLASSVIRSFLFNLLESYSLNDSAPILVSTTPRGQEHELGALIAGVVAASLGWKVVYLGANLPAEEIASVVSYLNAKVVAISLVYPSDDPSLHKELIKLKQILPSGVSMIAGGRVVDGYLKSLEAIQALIVKDIRQLKAELNAIRNINHN